MTEHRNAENNNKPITPIFVNKHRAIADGVVKAAIDEMKLCGVSRAQIIRILFDHFVHELGTLGSGGDTPTYVEHVENIAIIENIDERWTGIRTKMRALYPDRFSQHE